ncbi:hypothetical protein CC1G_00114 [Coprinopsis cinerea okayama7|uniref:DNA replication complex GINS protein PSF3 n=1 Tax=Coprinopsis cinerea (strain Okayama-7 / 130 / ATCC MYA-4618 / FGSC 9003) TaxID=240176 RepID=A8NWT1_COPC7|nr:hypothetical protein CC1G_00114 [Coprinopsis cinerea okayama7\|eukprot:XP_001836978.1 hypothetical protein CC1G_00114 [Coprinopsis cinerea okayama7\
MDNDYFSVEAILAENQKIQCTFKQEIPGMGHLAGGSDRDIAVLSKVQLPMWLAYIVIYSDWADFNIPPPFGLKVRNALNAEATSVRLSNLVGSDGSWYGFGKMIMDMLSEPQGTEMSKMMTTAFKARITELVDQAQHFAALGPGGAGGSSGDTAQLFRQGLDTTERELFLLAQESAKRIKTWYEENSKSRQ